jgi:photosystem II stability/assembly factor-like uncharacterized protein
MLRSTMALRVTAAISAVALLSGAPSVAGEINRWSTIGFAGVDTGPLAAPATAPRTIYAAADGNLMKTTDGGAHWSDVHPTWGGYKVRRMTIQATDPESPSTLYVIPESVFPGGGIVLKTSDGGEAWTQAYTNFSAEGLGALAIAPSEPSTLFVGGADIGNAMGGILKSTDGGASWTVTNAGLPMVLVSNKPFYLSATALAVDPTSADIVYAGTQAAGIFNKVAAKLVKSTDGGGSWLSTPLDLPVDMRFTHIVIDPATASTVYVTYDLSPEAAHEGVMTRVMKSIDAGTTWTAVPSPSTEKITALVIDPADSRRLYAASASGIQRSTDGAASWTPLNEGLTTLDVADLSIDATGTVLRAATSAGLFEYRYPAPASDVVPVVEYYHAMLDHYFITSNASEIALLDYGVPAGWTSTGLQFNARADGAGGASPVCRFYSTAFGDRGTHFYTPFGFECALLRPDAHWTLESEAAFHIAVPSGDGVCAAGLSPVYRLFNNGHGGAPNHRYTTDPAVRAKMIADGWVAEGFGPDAVQMCAPQ